MAPSDQTAVRNPSLSLSFGNVYGDGRYEGMALATVDPELSEDLFSLHLRVAYVLNQHQPRHQLCSISRISRVVSAAVAHAGLALVHGTTAPMRNARYVTSPLIYSFSSNFRRK